MSDAPSSGTNVIDSPDPVGPNAGVTLIQPAGGTAPKATGSPPSERKTETASPPAPGERPSPNELTAKANEANTTKAATIGIVLRRAVTSPVREGQTGYLAPPVHSSND